jgi:hypothetical protein
LGPLSQYWIHIALLVCGFCTAAFYALGSRWLKNNHSATWTNLGKPGGIYGPSGLHYAHFLHSRAWMQVQDPALKAICLGYYVFSILTLSSFALLIVFNT